MLFMFDSNTFSRDVASLSVLLKGIVLTDHHRAKLRNKVVLFMYFLNPIKVRGGIKKFVH